MLLYYYIAHYTVIRFSFVLDVAIPFSDRHLFLVVGPPCRVLFCFEKELFLIETDARFSPS